MDKPISIELSEPEFGLIVTALLKLPGETGAFGLLKRLEAVGQAFEAEKSKPAQPDLKMVSTAP